MADDRICSVDGCGKPHYCRSLCRRHYRRLLRSGDTDMELADAGEPDRYLNDVVINYDRDECLFWPFARSKGYASISRGVGRSALVHRIVCERVHGPSVGGRKYAAHSCGKGHLGCVNPKHLRWATHQENMMDRIDHGTDNRGERSGHARLTRGDVLTIRAMFASGLSQPYIARKFDVARTTVSSITSGRSWAWL